MSENSALQTMLKRMLKPLVRLLLQRGITYTALLEPLKSLYIEVASASAKLDEKRLTDSRISLLTGVHRKEVKRLREEIALSPEQTLAEIKASLGASVVAKWLSEPDYCQENGEPKILEKTGKAPSFEALVYSISKDKHYRSLLDDLLAQQMIAIEDNQVKLLQQGFIPSEDEAEKLFFAGKNLGAHIQAVAHNLQKNQSLPAMFDRAVYYQNLTQHDINLIEAEAKKRNLETLKFINQMAASAKRKHALEHQNTKDSDTRYGFHFGSYFLRTEKTELMADDVADDAKDHTKDSH